MAETEKQNVQFIGTSDVKLAEMIADQLAGKIAEIKNAIPTNEQLLTRKETAELLKVDISTLWHWSKKGVLKSYGIGNRVFYKRSEIMAALTELNNKKGGEK